MAHHSVEYIRMISCPHCSVELKAETLSVGSGLVCPSCGSEIHLDSDDLAGLSSMGGPPGDDTFRSDPGSASDSSLGGSSFANTGFTDSEFPSEEPASSDLPEGTLQASGEESYEDDLDTPAVDATMAFDGSSFDDDSDPLLLGDDEEGSDRDDRDPGESIDATVDYEHLARLARESPDDLTVDDVDATIAHDGRRPNTPSLLTGEGQDGGDNTQTPGPPPGLLGGQAPAAGGDATLPADSGKGAQGPSDSSLSQSSLTGSDEASDRTESPSTFSESDFTDRDSATLAFDSERRSDHIQTPQPRELTGLESGNTVPRGPLEEGRGSHSLKPGESQIVGSESVRLRAFLLADKSTEDPTGLDYAIEGEAGKGGMGVVYKARQQSLDRLVAIKQIKTEMGATDSDCNKFVSEAVITGQLEHPNIAPVHDLGLAADGLPFYAMKFVEGEDWEDAIKRLSEDENLAILLQVAQAIAFAHSRDVIHRDLKPGNVRLGAFGEVLVMDWGLAARLDDGSEIQPAGTPIYMPPETALEYLDYAKGRVIGGSKRLESSRRRLPAGKYSDIYLLGALLFKVVTRRAPHRGKSTFECLRAAAKNEIVKVKRSSELLEIAYKAMATDPQDRYPTALDFIEAIKAYQAHAQSILIASRASRELRAAEKLREVPGADATEVYACYSRAQHGYQNALELWDGNSKAKRRLKRTLRHFAESAYANGDYDLTLSLLDSQSEEDTELRTTVLKDQKSRNARLAWFKTLQYATAASLLVALGFIAYSVVLKQDAVHLRSELVTKLSEVDEAKREVDGLRIEASKQQTIAEDQTRIAAAKTLEAEQKAQEVERLTRLAQDKTDEAEAATRLAGEKQLEADKAIQVAAEQSREAKTQSYYAALGRVRSSLADSGAYSAWKTMQVAAPTIPPDRLADPEWLSLARTVDWRSEAAELVDEASAAGPTHLATTPDGDRCVAAANTANGAVRLTTYQRDADTPDATYAIPGRVDLVAISHDGRYAAVVGDGLTLVDLNDGLPLASRATPPSKGVTTVAFHPLKAELLTGDRRSRVVRWSIENGTLRPSPTDPVVNDGPITAVGYSPDGGQRFSADGSGRIVLWRDRGDGTLADREVYSHEEVASGSKHISSAAMSGDMSGRLVYGCDDGLIYEIAGWWPDSNLEGRPLNAADSTTRPPPALRLDGSGFLDTQPTRLRDTHAGAVVSIAYADAAGLILSAGGDTLLVQRTATQPSGAAIKRERRYHDQPLLSVASGGAGFAYSSDERGRLLRWRLRVDPDQQVVAPAGAGAGVAAVHYELSRKGAGALVVADRDGFVRRWADVAANTDVVTQFTGHADNRDMRAWRVGGEEPLIVTVAPEERWITNHRGVSQRVIVTRACLWDERTGLLQRTLDLGERNIVAVDGATATLFAAASGRLLDANDPHAVAAAYPLDGGQPTPLWSRRARVSTILPLNGLPLNGDNASGPTMAVGLRDGQVYLWGPQSGRIELVRSSARPHWRPIRSLAYDPANQRLYSGDAAGSIAKWRVGQQADPVVTRLGSRSASAIEPIVRLQLAGGGRLLAVQRRQAGQVAPVLLDDRLRPLARGRLAVDACFDPAAGGVTALCQSGASEAAVETWVANQGDWQTTASEPARDGLTGLTASQAGWLTWGPGFAQWRPASNGRHPITSRVISRPASIALVGASAEGLTTLTSINSVDVWGPGGRLVEQLALGSDARILATCPGADGELVIAFSAGEQTTQVERWDLSRRQRTGVVAQGLTGRCRAITASGGPVVLAFDGRVVVAPNDGSPQRTVALPADASPAVAVASSPGAGWLALATESGELLVARLDRGRAARFVTLGRDDVTSIAFTPDGRRLLAGVQSGRVLLLEPPNLEAAEPAARTLLTFSGHSDRVTLLQVNASERGTTVVSGDASGKVVVRDL